MSSWSVSVKQTLRSYKIFDVVVERDYTVCFFMILNKYLPGNPRQVTKI